ncbi:MAG: DnaB-like helicase C-terminal domain-containing protein [Gemmatimonadales bacterium]
MTTGFASLDNALGGGFRRHDLIVLGGDVGSGKSALAIAIALRVAAAGKPVAFLSGEMDEDRIMERALAIEGRAAIDDLRAARLPPAVRSAVGAAALRLRNLPLHVYPMKGASLEEELSGACAMDPALVIIDYLQLLTPAESRSTQSEDCAASIRAIKAFALDTKTSCLAVSQLPRHSADRTDRRPTLDDFGALGSIKQHADVVLGLYREEMYQAGAGVEGATELIIAKNRNGPTGFIDLYFYKQFMRFEDMLDPSS